MDDLTSDLGGHLKRHDQWTWLCWQWYLVSQSLVSDNWISGPQWVYYCFVSIDQDGVAWGALSWQQQLLKLLRRWFFPCVLLVWRREWKSGEWTQMHKSRSRLFSGCESLSLSFSLSLSLSISSFFFLSQNEKYEYECAYEGSNGNRNSLLVISQSRLHRRSVS